MAYSDNFSIQWNRLVSDFTSSINGYTPEMVSVNRLNDWYKANSFRWHSIAENEGILLEHENNAALSRELWEALEKFSFHEVEISKKPKGLSYIGTGILLAAGMGVLLKLCFHLKFIFIVIEAVVLLLASVVLYAKKLDDCGNRQKKEIVDGYSGQLADYKECLIEICKKYEK